MTSRQQGIGLAEMLISLLLASLIMTALMNHYLSTKTQYQHIQTNLEQAYEVQLVTDLVRDSVRRAGFTPCLNINHLFAVDHRNRHTNLVDIDLSNNASLQINRMSEYFETVTSIVNSKELLITRTHEINLEQHPILIADCYHAEVHTISQSRVSAGNQIIKLSHPLSFSYQSPIYIGEWIEERFFIKSQGVKNSLFYHFNHSDELSEHIESMSVSLTRQQNHNLVQVLFGLNNARELVLETMVRAS